MNLDKGSTYKKINSADSIFLVPSKCDSVSAPNSLINRSRSYSFNCIKANPKYIYNRVKRCDNIPTQPFDINNHFDNLPSHLLKTVQ